VTSSLSWLVGSSRQSREFSTGAGEGTVLDKCCNSLDERHSGKLMPSMRSSHMQLQQQAYAGPCQHVCMLHGPHQLTAAAAAAAAISHAQACLWRGRSFPGWRLGWIRQWPCPGTATCSSTTGVLLYCVTLMLYCN
jgi:hypothetical protein